MIAQTFFSEQTWLRRIYRYLPDDLDTKTSLSTQGWIRGMEFEKINRVGEVDKTEGHSHFRLILKCFLLLCAPNTSGFFYIKTNFFNKRSFTRVAQSAKVHFHKPPPWEEALWDIFIRQRGNQMQFGVGRLRCGIIQVYPLSTNRSNFVSLSKILFKTSYVFKRKIPSDTSIHISVNGFHLFFRGRNPTQ